MATKSRRTSAALIDTNVLVDATDVKRPRHARVLELLERQTALVVCAQVAREYLVVATRPVERNGLGLPTQSALENLTEFRRVARLLSEEKALLPTLLGLLSAVPCQGKSIHDALIVATMRVHDVPVLITSNRAHFERFGEWIEIEEP